MAKLDPELLARMPKPPADYVPLKPPVMTAEERAAYIEAMRLRTESYPEDDEDDDMTNEEFNQAVRDI